MIEYDMRNKKVVLIRIAYYMLGLKLYNFLSVVFIEIA
jgi:hypothetical protein